MSKIKRGRAKARFERESTGLCVACQGTGRILSESAIARAKKGGNVSYLVSLCPEQLSMSERGQKGGRPKEPTLDDLVALDRDTESSSLEELAPESGASRPDPRQRVRVQTPAVLSRHEGLAERC